MRGQKSPIMLRIRNEPRAGRLIFRLAFQTLDKYLWRKLGSVGVDPLLSAALNSLSVFGERDLMLFELLVEGTPRNSQSLGSLFDTAVLFQQYSLNVVLFELKQGELRVG
jgi:hypothetical protein